MVVVVAGRVVRRARENRNAGSVVAVGGVADSARQRAVALDRLEVLAEEGDAADSAHQMAAEGDTHAQTAALGVGSSVMDLAVLVVHKAAADGAVGRKIAVAGSGTAAGTAELTLTTREGLRNHGAL